MRQVTVFGCDYCERVFGTKEECEEHMRSHIRRFEFDSDGEICAELLRLAENAWGYSIENTVFGMPVKNFENLMAEAAKRIRGY